jgi:hypothetical protein
MNKSCQDLRPMLSDYLDGILERKERSELEDHLQNCPDCQHEIETERQVINILTCLPYQICPERVTQKIEDATDSMGKPYPYKIKRQFHFDFYHWKPLYVGFALTLIVILILLKPFRPHNDGIEDSVSQEDLLKARNQAKWSLAYIAEVIHDAQKQAVDDVLMNELPKTFRKSIRSTFSIVKGEKK